MDIRIARELRQLETMAREQGTSVDDLLRDLLRYARHRAGENGAEQERTCYELAEQSGLVGIVRDARTDLSSSPDHFEMVSGRAVAPRTVTPAASTFRIPAMGDMVRGPHRGPGRAATDSADLFPWLVTLASLAAALWLFLHSTMPAIAERRQLDAIDRQLRADNRTLEVEVESLRTRRLALPHDPELQLVELDQLGLMPADAIERYGDAGR
jgi:hypothetical protein